MSPRRTREEEVRSAEANYIAYLERILLGWWHDPDNPSEDVAGIVRAVESRRTVEEGTTQ